MTGMNCSFVLLTFAKEVGEENADHSGDPTGRNLPDGEVRRHRARWNLDHVLADGAAVHAKTLGELLESETDRPVVFGGWCEEVAARDCFLESCKVELRFRLLRSIRPDEPCRAAHEDRHRASAGAPRLEDRADECGDFGSTRKLALPERPPRLLDLLRRRPGGRPSSTTHHPRPSPSRPLNLLRDAFDTSIVAPRLAAPRSRAAAISIEGATIVNGLLQVVVCWFPSK
ncbi:MAG: hypothetical protein ACT4TC_21910 [Myxococcaceae bacterium]